MNLIIFGIPIASKGALTTVKNMQKQQLL